MKCSNCGNELAEGAKFCPKCGTKVAEAMPTSATPVESAKEAHVDTPNESAALKAEPKPKKKLNKKAIVGVVAAVLIAGGGFGGYSYYQKTQWDKLTQDARSVVEQKVDDEFGASFNGFVPNNYVNVSSYSVTDFQIGNVARDGDSVNGTATATTENESFRSTIDLSFTAAAASDGSLSNVDVEVTDKSTVPIKGIDYDTSNGFQNLNLSLSGDNSCTYKQDKPDANAWYYASGIKECYSYRFNEDSGWSFDNVSEEVPEDGKYADLSGTYSVPGGSNANAYLKLSNYNAHDSEYRRTYTVEISSDYVVSGKTSGVMTFKKDHVALEDLDNGLISLSLGETGMVVGADSISGAEEGDCQLQIVMNPSVPGGVNVFKLDKNGLEVLTGYQKRGKFLVHVMTEITGGYLSGLTRFNASSFSQNPPAPQFVRE